ncbi:flagellar basal body rod protein FlgB [Candidatus Odyssella thessalonicensis]|uniref:flagellar basal body rod protein FlgB n=1 Tax=Candidatus Odyssella thessalonicensis TaxID=84647 RepID=UPI000225BB01|nr:hypothetical protein [Candidatus Odyssella thessalonicensis]
MAIQGNVLNQLVNKMSWNIARNQRLNSNIANFDVPDYKRVDIQPFTKSLRHNNAGSPNSVHIKEIATPAFEMSRETEMLQLTENVANYQTNLNLFKKYLGLMKTVLGRAG